MIRFCCSHPSEISIRLGSELLESFGVARSDEVQSAKMDLRRTLVELARKGDIKGDVSGLLRLALCLRFDFSEVRDIAEIETLTFSVSELHTLDDGWCNHSQ